MARELLLLIHDSHQRLQLTRHLIKLVEGNLDNVLALFASAKKAAAPAPM